jgi:hypothetical protein
MHRQPGYVIGVLAMRAMRLSGHRGPRRSRQLQKCLEQHIGNFSLFANRARWRPVVASGSSCALSCALCTSVNGLVRSCLLNSAHHFGGLIGYEKSPRPGWLKWHVSASCDD